MIGVALVTAVTIVAQGLEQQGRGQLEDAVKASTIVTATDGWSPIDPEIERAVAGVGTVSSLRQDGALVFGKQEAVNAVDPASIGGFFDYDWKEGGQRHSRPLGATAPSSTTGSRPSTGSGWAARSRSRR